MRSIVLKTIDLFLYIKILVSEQGNTICEKTVEFSQIVDYEERQKGLS